jgi:hypothetical protein
MAKIVYDLTVDRKRTPLSSSIVKAKIANNEVKVKGKQPKAKREEKPATAEKQKAEETKPKAETKKPTFTDEQFLEALKAVGHPATSREVSDKLGFDPDKGRAIVRRAMDKLIAEGKVVSVESPKKPVKQLYKLA